MTEQELQAELTRLIQNFKDCGKAMIDNPDFSDETPSLNHLAAALKLASFVAYHEQAIFVDVQRANITPTLAKPIKAEPPFSSPVTPGMLCENCGAPIKDENDGFVQYDIPLHFDCPDGSTV